MRNFIAKLAPIGVTSHPADGYGVRKATRLLPTAFASQAGKVELPVYAFHATDSVELGRLKELTRVGPWWMGAIELDDDTEAMGIHSGQSLSVGYSVDEAYIDREGMEWVGRATLEEVSVVDVGAFEGAALGMGYVPTEAQARANRESLGAKGILARDLIQIPGHVWVDADDVIERMERTRPIDFPGHTWVP